MEYNTKNKDTIKLYLSDTGLYEYKFVYNNKDAYSCKFIDKKYNIDDFTNKLIENLEYNCYKNNEIDCDLIEMFLDDMLHYFRKYEQEMENDGYNYLYEITDAEAEEECSCNEWYFTENGKFIE